MLSLDISAAGVNSATNLAASLGSNYTSENSTSLDSAENTPTIEKRNSFPHVQQFQYKEFAAFCQLFNGSLVVISNDIESKSDSKWKMFELRGELSEESHLIEIGKLSAESLRSKTSFLFVNNKESKFIVWHGCCSNELLINCLNGKT